MAAQFGVSGFTEPTGQSPEFYASLLASHQLLGALVDTAFQVGTDRNASITLAEYFRVAGPDSIHLRQAAIDRLRDAVSASVSVKTGMVNVSVRLHSPDLAYQVLQRQLGLLNEFNLGTRRSRARAERLFIEGRLQEAREEMRQVEDRLLNFLQRNRDFRTSSTLAFEHDRLQRDVAMRQQIVTALAQSYEQARIDEVRDTPVITVVEEPTVPVLPDSRRVIGRSLTGMLLGFFLGVLAGLWREFLTRSRHREETEFDEFVSLRAAALDELRHPFRALRRVASVR
ncbi:MAG: hypothetical protein E6J42_06155 [Chloroflexi bacterium]|nr:MAG: hypothetical protein E6J42_06155 [Chloroflexota bacterium]